VIVLIDGAAPYLGGPATWRKLQAELTEFRCVLIDPLDAAAAPDVGAAMRALVVREIGNGAIAIIAHASAARVVLEAVYAAGTDIPVLLLNPLLFVRNAPVLRIVRALL